MPSGVFRALLISLSVILLGVAFAAQRAVNLDREKLGLTRLKPLENAPPVLAFTTVALGGFRGLIANALWIRVSDLQDQDKHFEMVQLSDWITKLTPYIPAVWYHLAWNMAYNISVKFPSPADRWMWVQRGIELLRDEGLKYNPRETLLYRELSWFFQHKMGHNLDDAHLFYKRQWAEKMTGVLGEGRPNWEALTHPSTEEERERVRALREVYKLDPAFMKEVDERYGPLEWRLPEAHAIYWAAMGQKVAKKEDQVTLRRSIYQSMQLSFARGALIHNRIDGSLALGPNLDIIPKASQAYEDMMAQEPANAHLHETGHRYFLRKAVYHLYTFNRLREAEKWFAYLKQKYPQAVPANQRLEDFAVDEVTEDVSETNVDETTSVIRALLVNSFMELLQDEDERAANYELMSRRVWQRYTERTASQKGRVGLRPYAELRQQTLDQLLDPQRGLTPLLNAALRSKLGLPAATNAPPPVPNAG
jgi:hypothetical protein